MFQLWPTGWLLSARVSGTAFIRRLTWYRPPAAAYLPLSADNAAPRLLMFESPDKVGMGRDQAITATSLLRKEIQRLV